MAAIPGLPATLKAIQPYLKSAKEYEKRDPIVAYYLRLYAVQKGIKIDSKSKEGKLFLYQLMDQLEKCKKELAHEEAISSETVGQTYVDEQATQLFLWADTEDRAARFNKNVIKSFYTASLVYEILTQFGELSEEAAQRQKYSKWKATNINKCLKEGITPVPGPPLGDEAASFGDEFADIAGGTQGLPPPFQPSSGTGGYPPDPYNPGQSHNQPPAAQPPSYQQPSLPSNTYQPAVPEPDTSSTNSGISSEELDKAQKFCRFAQSALQYEDIKTAVDNLQKALTLLRPYE